VEHEMMAKQENKLQIDIRVSDSRLENICVNIIIAPCYVEGGGGM